MEYRKPVQEKETAFMTRLRYSQEILDAPHNTEQILSELQGSEEEQLGFYPAAFSKESLAHRNPTLARYEIATTVSSTAFAAAWHMTTKEIMARPSPTVNVPLDDLESHRHLDGFRSEKPAAYTLLVRTLYHNTKQVSDAMLVNAAHAQRNDPEDPQAVFWECVAAAANARAIAQSKHFDYLDIKKANDPSYTRPHQHNPWDATWYGAMAENVFNITVGTLLPFYSQLKELEPDELFNETVTNLDFLQRHAQLTRAAHLHAHKRIASDRPLEMQVESLGREYFKQGSDGLRWRYESLNHSILNPAKCSGVPRLKVDPVLLSNYYRSRGILLFANSLPNHEISSLDVGILEAATLIRSITLTQGALFQDVWLDIDT